MNIDRNINPAPGHYSQAEIRAALEFIATELGPLRTNEELDADIAKAELAAARMPPPDKASFKAHILEHIKRRRAERDQTGLIAGVDFQESPPVALAARKRKSPLRRKPRGRTGPGNEDAPAGSQ
jgi:hypothetical protein